MYRKLLNSKIHRATVTQADLHYEGSITLSPELMKAARLVAYESVHVWNVSTGTRFETYTMEGLPGSADICINGAAAHRAKPGDIVIIASFAFVKEKYLDDHRPVVVFVDERNQAKTIRKELAGPQTRE